jgi:hypothetical protein
MKTEELKARIRELETAEDSTRLRAALKIYCRYHLRPNDLKEVPELAAFL